ncbi:MAG: transferase [Methylomarinum sp.]|nr:transferase [Methylomarinum sp.]
MRYQYFIVINSIIRRLRAVLCYFLSGVSFSSVGTHCKVQGNGIYTGSKIRIGDFCWIESVDYYHNQSFSPVIHISDNVTIADFVHISAIKHIFIGAGTLIGSKVYIGDHSHGNYKNKIKWEYEKNVLPALRPLADESDIIIGKNCWIGDGAILLAGSEIGDNCVIGANSVLKGKFLANSLIAGAPAKLKKKFDV